MKVILLQDVAKIGKRFDEVEVPNGYALNKLIPQGAATSATPAERKRVMALKASSSAANEASAEQFDAAKEVLAATPLTVSKSANEQGHLYEAVHAADIVAAATDAGATLVSEQIKLAEPIKEVGEHVVTVTHGDASFSLTITVTAA